MDDELIPKKSLWQQHWRWFVPISALGFCFLVFVGLMISSANEEPGNLAFDKNKWNAANEQGYIYRKEMIKNLMASNKLKKLDKNEIIEMLGEPTRTDSAYLFYMINQRRIGFVVLHTKTLVIKLSDEEKGNSIMIHE